MPPASKPSGHGHAREVANAALFLVSGEASSVNSAQLLVDNGFTAFDGITFRRGHSTDYLAGFFVARP